MRDEERRHTGFIHTNANAVAGDAGMGHFEKSVTNPVSIANATLIIRNALDKTQLASIYLRLKVFSA